METLFDTLPLVLHLRTDQTRFRRATAPCKRPSDSKGLSSYKFTGLLDPQIPLDETGRVDNSGTGIEGRNEEAASEKSADPERLCVAPQGKNRRTVGGQCLVRETHCTRHKQSLVLRVAEGKPEKVKGNERRNKLSTASWTASRKEATSYKPSMSSLRHKLRDCLDLGDVNHLVDGLHL